MTEVTWREVLQRIYTNDEYWSMETSNLSKLAKDLEIEESEVKKHIEKLEGQELIKREIDELHLTQRGFDYINSLEMHKEQQTTDRVLLVFTTVLTIGILITTSIALTIVNNPVMNISIHALYAIVFLVLGIMISKNTNIF